MDRSPTNSTLHRIAFIGNYLPRQCGIATFTTDLCEAFAAEYSGATQSPYQSESTKDCFRLLNSAKTSLFFKGRGQNIGGSARLIGTANDRCLIA